MAKRAYDRVRGNGSWEQDKAEKDWESNEYCYLAGYIIQLMAMEQASRRNPSKKAPAI